MNHIKFRLIRPRVAWTCGLAIAVTMFGASMPLFAETQVVIVGVRADLPKPLGTTSDELIEEVKTQKQRTMLQSLGNPVDANHSFGRVDYPTNGLLPAEDSAIHLMRRYVNLVYATPFEAVSAEVLLKTDARFGYVGLVSEGGFSAALTPTDEFFSRPSGNTDPLFTGFQWGMHALQMPNAWGYTPGWGRVGMIEGRGDVYVPDLVDQLSYFGSFDLGGYVTSNGRTGARDIIYRPATAGYHGTHSDGIAVASANNPRPGQSFGQGVSGACQNCMLQHASAAALDERMGSARWLTAWGAQIVNLSGYIVDGSDPQVLPERSDCPSYGYSELAHPFCAVLAFMRERDVLFFAASGNNKGDVQFPARDPAAIAVGGIDVLGNLWNEVAWVEPPENSVGCPEVHNVSNETGTHECGSNFGASQDFVAPARRIVSTVSPGSSLSTQQGWSDAGFPPSNDGYGYLTGTSMSAPHLSGLAGLVRSIQPLASAPDVVALMGATASGNGVRSDEFGWGLPNAGVLAERALGKSQGSQLTNRLTPMFVLKNDLDHDRLYTSNPTLAAAAMYGEYMVLPECRRLPPSNEGSLSCLTGAEYTGANGEGSAELRPYESPDWTNWVDSSGVYHTPEATPIAQAEVGWPFIGYNYPSIYSSGVGLVPTSSFYVFTTNQAVLGRQVAPLHKLAFDSECDRRDHVYATSNADLVYFTTTDFCPKVDGVQSYRREGIEGYVLSSCPTGAQFHSCKTLPPPYFAEEFRPVANTAWPQWYGKVPQPLYRRYNPNAEEGYILLLGSQLADPEFARFSGFVNGSGPIGYVFPNIDSDGDEVIDGQELLLNTSALGYDSDCDGYSDGEEYPPLGYQATGRDPRSPGQNCADVVSLTMTAQVIQTSATSKTIRYSFSSKNNTSSGKTIDVNFDSWLPGSEMSNTTMSSGSPGCYHRWTYGFTCTPVAAGATVSVTYDAVFDYDPPQVTAASAGKLWAYVNLLNLPPNQTGVPDPTPDNNVVYHVP